MGVDSINQEQCELEYQEVQTCLEVYVHGNNVHKNPDHPGFNLLSVKEVLREDRPDQEPSVKRRHVPAKERNQSKCSEVRKKSKEDVPEGTLRLDMLHRLSRSVLAPDEPSVDNGRDEVEIQSHRPVEATLEEHVSEERCRDDAKNVVESYLLNTQPCAGKREENCRSLEPVDLH